MKFQSRIVGSLFIGASCIQNSIAFVVNNQQSSSLIQRSMSSSDDTAKAFTEYMAKSHTEKLKALKELEGKKNSEIQALKEELKKAQSNDSGSIVGSTPPPAPVVQGSIEDLSAKLAAYQKFMSEYVVKAQLEKYEAVKAAEVSIAKKYEDKLNAFMLTGGVEEKAGAIAPASASSDDNKLFEQRNAHLAAAAKAGKSRWGNQEIEKVSGIVVEKTTPATPTPVENPPPNASPEVIAKADHGLRADGGVGGLTLTERVVNGSEAVNGRSASVVASSSSDSSLYAMRNARVAEAAKAGKSRWGSQEVEKVTDIMSKAPQTMKIEASPEVEAADHGLRADGGVGGPSLAERVNLGAQLLE